MLSQGRHAHPIQLDMAVKHDSLSRTLSEEYPFTQRAREAGNTEMSVYPPSAPSQIYAPAPHSLPMGELRGVVLMAEGGGVGRGVVGSHRAQGVCSNFCSSVRN